MELDEINVFYVQYLFDVVVLFSPSWDSNGILRSRYSEPGPKRMPLEREIVIQFGSTMM
jgi:hypothetical protein